MPRLLVMRAGVLEQQIDLRGQMVRIGRGATNDLILDDPVKSVSRDHAEMRLQGSRYVLVDLQSQNGIWVAGTRVPHVVLEPDVAVTIGPFRLLIDAGGGDSASVVTEDEESADRADTYQGDGPSSEPEPEALPPVAPVQSAASLQQWLAGHQTHVLGGAAALVLASVIWVVLASRDDTPSVDYAVRLAEAQQLITAGECERALSEIINPALQQSPDDPDVMRLAAEAQACPQTVVVTDTPATPAEHVALHFDQAREALAASDCTMAQEYVRLLRDIVPEDLEATDLGSRVESCLSATVAPTPVRPKPRTPAGPALAVEIPPEKGGLRVMTDETREDYQARIQSLESRFRDADAAAAAGDLERALTLFEGIVQIATDRYAYQGDSGSGVSERIQTVRARREEAAKEAIDAARALEKRGEFNQAIEEYRRAGGMDPRLNVQAEVARVTALKTAEGERLCQAARPAFAMNNYAAAAPLYARAAELLPPDHPCYADANKRKQYAQPKH